MFKFRFGGQGGSSPTQPPSIETVRRRARHRLLGATVLVLAGVIGFPLLFESQPRPVPADFEIDIPSRQAAKPQADEAVPSSGQHVAGLDESEEFVPSASGAPSTPVAPAVPVTPAAPVAPAPQVAKAPAEPPAAVVASVPLHPVVKPMPPAPAVQALAPAKPQPAPEPAARKPEPKPAEPKSTEPKPADKPVAKPQDKPVKSSEDSARALALLEGKSAPTASAEADKAAGKPRHIVQVGAFVDPNLAQEARAKLERSGLVTYTQISNTPDGPRTRVRLGPFATRAEADKAAAKARALGLSAAILAL